MRPGDRFRVVPQSHADRVIKSGQDHITEPLLRASDVAETIVSGYLFWVVGELQAEDHEPPSRAYYRVTPSKTAVPVHHGEFAVEPLFEVMVVVQNTAPGISTILAEVAATTPGHVYISGMAELDGNVSDADLAAGEWTKASIPEARAPAD